MNTWCKIQKIKRISFPHVISPCFALCFWYVKQFSSEFIVKQLGNLPVVLMHSLTCSITSR